VTRERKSRIAGVGVLIFTVILAGVAVTAHTTSEPEPEWLTVMNAETGQFQPAGNTYTLTLEEVDAQMLAFTDRPEREAQTWDTAAFLDAWANEFGGDPPNAVVSANGLRVAVTLSDPRVGMSARDDGAVTPRAGAVTFTATPLPRQEPPTSRINQPTLFIDFTSLRPTVSSRIRSNPSRPGLTDYGVDGGTYGGDEPAPNYVGDRQNGDVFDSMVPAPDSSPKLME
jgi:hypothetical protein